MAFVLEVINGNFQALDRKPIFAFGLNSMFYKEKSSLIDKSVCDRQTSEFEKLAKTRENIEKIAKTRKYVKTKNHPD